MQVKIRISPEPDTTEEDRRRDLLARAETGDDEAVIALVKLDIVNIGARPVLLALKAARDTLRAANEYLPSDAVDVERVKDARRLATALAKQIDVEPVEKHRAVVRECAILEYRLARAKTAILREKKTSRWSPAWHHLLARRAGVDPEIIAALARDPRAGARTMAEALVADRYGYRSTRQIRDIRRIYGPDYAPKRAELPFLILLDKKTRASPRKKSPSGARK